MAGWYGLATSGQNMNARIQVRRSCCTGPSEPWDVWVNGKPYATGYDTESEAKEDVARFKREEEGKTDAK